MDGQRDSSDLYQHETSIPRRVFLRAFVGGGVAVAFTVAPRRRAEAARQGLLVQSTGDATILAAYRLEGVKVGANPQDKWVLEGYTSIVVITQYGDVFGHDLVPNAEGQLTVGAAVQFTGPKVAANPPDKWVLNFGDQLVVITQDGGVFGHSFGAAGIGEPYQLEGPKVAANPPDKWVLRHGDRIIVITDDGRVFGHELDFGNKTVGEPYQFDGPAVAANFPDKWVLIVFDTILVITQDGAVFAHAINLSGRSIGEPFAVEGPTVAASPRDKWVLVDEPGGEILVVTQDGDVFAHPTEGLLRPA